MGLIRNGVVYRSSPTDMETRVLNWDGTMDIYSPNQINLQKLIDKGAYQSWIFKSRRKGFKPICCHDVNILISFSGRKC